MKSYKFEFLVDTGSAVSCLSKKIFDQLGHLKLSPISTALIAAGGENLQVYGQVKLTFTVQGCSFKHNFVVVDLDEIPGILGIDLLDTHQAQINISKALLIMPNGSEIKLNKKQNQHCALIRLREKLVLPANSESVFQVNVPKNMREDNMLIEPNGQLAKSGIVISNALVNAKENKVTISAINCRNNDVTLKKCKVIGNIQKVCQITEPLALDKTDETEIPEHLQCLLDNVSPKVNEEQKQEIKKLLIRFQDIFLGPDGKLGRTEIVKHTIDTGLAKPIKIPPRRVPLKQKEIIDQEIDKMLKDDIIEPSDSPWSSPVLLCLKKDQTWRFCIDYRALNQLTRKDAYPLPRIDTSLDSLGGNKWFNTVDMASGYWQCLVEDKDRPKTAFSCHRGLFQFKVMPFGLCNAPSCFERLMDIVLKGYQWERCLCYLDDVIIFGPTFEKALENLEFIFERFRQANLKLKPKKCSLFQHQVLFLGHLVTDEGIACDPSKIEAVKEWPTPTNVNEVRSFLGLAGYYRRFILNFSELASTLTNLTKKGVRFRWTSQCQESFECLKEKLISAPVLCYPVENGQFILDTDASGHAIGAVLSQVQEGEEKVIAYASKMLGDSQRKYCTTYRELLAVVTFVKYFRHYLLGQKFKVRTDHASLIWLKNFKNPEGMVARWITVLDSYNFTLEHRRGSQHANADALSRKPYRLCKRDDCPGCQKSEVCVDKVVVNPVRAEIDPDDTIPYVDNSTEQDETIPFVEENSDLNETTEEALDFSNWLRVWSQEELKTWQENDSDLSKIIEMKNQFDEKPGREQVSGSSYEVRTLWSLWESLEIVNDILYKKYEKLGESSLVLVVPKELRNKIMKELHNSRISGHLGRDRTLESVKRRFYWPGMSSDVASWVKECSVCARAKRGPGLGRYPLQQSLVGFPLDRIGIDIVGPCPVTENGNEYLIVVSDYFTKWCEAFAVPNHNALTIVDKLVPEFFCRFGIPKQIHSDQGREFESELFQAVCLRLGVEKTRTTPYRPQSDGLVERFNHTLQVMLSSFVNKHRNDWDDHLPYLLMAYRASENDSTGVTPYKMMLGREMTYPLDVIAGNPKNQRILCPVEYVQWLNHTFEITFNFARDNLLKAAVRQKNNYDRGIKPRNFAVGDFVWRWYPPTAGIKLGLGWIGPYKILEKITDVTYKIQESPDSRQINVHVDHLKPYLGAVPLVWVLDGENESENEQEDSFQTPDPSLNMSEPGQVEGPVDSATGEGDVINFKTPSPPKQSRCGRAIRKPNKYSP